MSVPAPDGWNPYATREQWFAAVESLLGVARNGNSAERLDALRALLPVTEKLFDVAVNLQAAIEHPDLTLDYNSSTNYAHNYVGVGTLNHDVWGLYYAPVVFGAVTFGGTHD